MSPTDRGSVDSECSPRARRSSCSFVSRRMAGLRCSASATSPKRSTNSTSFRLRPTSGLPGGTLASTSSDSGPSSSASDSRTSGRSSMPCRSFTRRMSSRRPSTTSRSSPWSTYVGSAECVPPSRTMPSTRRPSPSLMSASGRPT
ncbi:hypothetical protein COSO111634_14965 [Corallococcus soli]